jgi:hypothetical protein
LDVMASPIVTKLLTSAECALAMTPRVSISVEYRMETTPHAWAVTVYQIAAARSMLAAFVAARHLSVWRVVTAL